MENIWIAIIGFFKDIIVAVIGLFKKEKSSKTQKLQQKYDASEEHRDNPFIPSDADIENIDIKDPNYLSTIATNLASNRSSEDINVIDREGE